MNDRDVVIIRVIDSFVDVSKWNPDKCAVVSTFFDELLCLFFVKSVGVCKSLGFPFVCYKSLKIECKNIDGGHGGD